MRTVKERLKKFFVDNPKIRKTVGVTLIVLGALALLTPLTPGSWLIPIGLWLLGFRFLWWDKLKLWLRQERSYRILFVKIVKILGLASVLTGLVLMFFWWKIGATLFLSSLFLTGSVLPWLTSDKEMRKATILALIEAAAVSLLWSIL